MAEKPKAVENESKAARFKRLVDARMGAILEKLSVLGNCSSKATYDYTPEDVKKIFDAIRTKVGEVEAQFTQKPGEKPKGGFSL
jgi:hypothetical protein